MVEISIQNKNGKKASVCKCKKTIKHRKHKEYCAWNSSISAYDYKKDCNMGKNQNKRLYMHEKSCW